MLSIPGDFVDTFKYELLAEEVHQLGGLSVSHMAADLVGPVRVRRHPHLRH